LGEFWFPDVIGQLRAEREVYKYLQSFACFFAFYSIKSRLVILKAGLQCRWLCGRENQKWKSLEIMLRARLQNQTFTPLCLLSRVSKGEELN
jgi:hypothetical protein